MAHCMHILAPPCAWATSTEPKSTCSIRTRLGNAVRALTPRRTRKNRDESSDLSMVDEINPALNVDVLTTLDTYHSPGDKMKRRWSEDEGSTRLDSSSSSSTASIEEVTSLPGSVEEVPAPSSTSSASGFSDDEDDHVQAKCGFDAKHRAHATELHRMALLISRRAASKYSGRVSADVRSAFLAVDANGDGKVSAAETAAFCRHFDMTPEIATRFFALLDPHETGAADWSSFLAKYAPVFRENATFRLNPGESRHYPAL